jgi:DNA invertase Pin-like site-specific DNA recombinase
VGKFVAYYRVSTKRQGASGLGLDAQKTAVQNYLNGGSCELEGVHRGGEEPPYRLRLSQPATRLISACRIT